MIQIGEKTSLIDQLGSTLPESIYILVEVSENKLVIALASVPPNYDKVKFVEELDKKREFLAAFSVPIVWLRDFNIDTLRENNLQLSFLDTKKFNGFELLIKCPTRLSDASEICLDHVITRIIVITITNVLIDQCFSDHYPILLITLFGL